MVLTHWVERAPDLNRLQRTVSNVRSRVDATEHFQAIQELSTKFNARLAKSVGIREGLRGRYYGDTRLQKFILERVDEDLAFQWKWKSPDRRVPNDRFSARWDGWLTIDKRDKYNFWFICSDGIRVWIDGVKVIDDWRRANDNSVAADVLLEAGRHDIRVEYFETVGEAGIKCFFTAETNPDVLDFGKFLSHPAQ